jgi:hypothetical protein
MAQILKFRSPASTPEAISNPKLDRHLVKYQWHYGRDAFWHYVKKHGELPCAATAQSLANMLGHKIKSKTNSYFSPSVQCNGYEARKLGCVHQEQLQQIIDFIEHSAHAIEQFEIEKSAVEVLKTNNEHLANQIERALSWWIVLSDSWSRNGELNKRPTNSKNS